MSEQFRPPGFLREGIEPKPFHGEEYEEGMFAVVAKLENVPQRVKERVPQGYVIKQYKMSEHDWHHYLRDDDVRGKAFKGGWGDLLNEQNFYGPTSKEAIMDNLMGAVGSYVVDSKNRQKPTLDDLHQHLLAQERAGILNPQEKMFLDREVLTRWWNESSLMGMAKELKRRHGLVQTHFKDTLPNLVVDTQFMVGSPDGNTEQAHLYEIQKQIVPLQTWQRMREGVAEMSRLAKEGDWDACSEYGAKNPIYRAYAKSSLYYKHPLENERDQRNLIESTHDIAQAVRDELKDKPVQLRCLKTELRKFIAKARTLPKVQDWIPYDTPWLDNLVFTEEGLRVIDTNQGVQPSRMVRAENREKVTAQYKRALEILEAIRENL